jgi:Phosphate starvation-inducible protein PhoH, predicted ATPase
MFLTRLGFGSTAVITGDVTQIDLPPGKTSGLRDAIEVLHELEGVSFTFLTPMMWSATISSSGWCAPMTVGRLTRHRASTT